MPNQLRFFYLAIFHSNTSIYDKSENNYNMDAGLYPRIWLSHIHLVFNT